MASQPPTRRGYQDIAAASSSSASSTDPSRRPPREGRFLERGRTSNKREHYSDGRPQQHQQQRDYTNSSRDDRSYCYGRGGSGLEDERRLRRGENHDNGNQYDGNSSTRYRKEQHNRDHHREQDSSASTYHRNQNDWQCLECHTWNYPDEGLCHRCGAYADDDLYGYHHDNGDSSSSSLYPNDVEANRHPPREYDRNARRNRHDIDMEESHDDNGDLDEFGRARKKTKPSTMSDHGDVDERKKTTKKHKALSSSEWPPCFDTHGADFVLDARCGMFYHSESNFFYDPQTKLYYGNRQATYYKYDPCNKAMREGENDPGDTKQVRTPFVAVQKAEHSASSVSDHPADAVLCSGGSNSSKAAGKSSISITLKTKKLPKSSSKKKKEGSSIASNSSPAAVPTVPTVQRRQHDADISKWSERQEEMKQEDPHQSSKAADTKKPDSDEKDNKTITRTAKGEPICTLCKRKFPSVEKLRYHERVSKLHAENLAKKQQQADKTEDVAAFETKGTGMYKESSPSSPQQPSSGYVDRARQRRQMHGQDTRTEASAMVLSSPPVVPLATAPPPGEPQPTHDVVRPDQTLGDHNVGNQMLQKLGWKSGQSIGRRAQQQKQGQNDKEGSGTSNNGDNPLKKDWERIEALAAQRK